MADGPAEGLVLVDEIEAGGALSDYYLLPATRADLLRRLGRREEAAASYRRALEMAPSEPVRRFMQGRLSE
jgi:RNA polymerase sigma-70 factor, ECF subfamily